VILVGKALVILIELRRVISCVWHNPSILSLSIRNALTGQELMI
jgi:hypothetical protein